MAVKIQYASDLHLEFPENKEFLKTRPLRPEGEILILSGDIVPFRFIHDHMDFFDYLAHNFSMTYWVPGNHEYYYSDIASIKLTMHEKIKDNVLLVNNISISQDKTDLIFSTLWTKISQANRFDIQIRYSDFHAIRFGDRLLDIEQYNNIHNFCLSFLREELKSRKTGHTVVVSHHMPTFHNYPDEYKGDILNEAFAVELSGLIKDTEPDYWIFGHHHSNKGDFNIGDTRLVTNQLGYVIYGEQAGYNEGKTIVV